MPATNPLDVLVTGASSGIGRATALHLAGAGMRVFATCRRSEDGEALRAAATGTVVPLVMDVTRPETISAARQEIEGTTIGAGLDGLVNNAGIGLSAPVETSELAQVRALFEVNLFGQLAVIQEFLPLLRRRAGRIVNLGSVGAHVAVPFFGALCASKAAFEMYSDALRLELRPFGIHVCIIQPGAVHTPAVGKTLGGAEAAIGRWPADMRPRYGALFRRFTERATAREQRGSAPEVVARVIHEALTSQRPRIRYPVGKDARLLAVLPRLLPDAVRDRLVLRMLGLPARFGALRTAATGVPTEDR